MEDLDEKLFCANVWMYYNNAKPSDAHIYISNIRSKNRSQREFRFDPEDARFDTIKQNQPQQEVSEFIVEHVELINKLEAIYGEENVQVLWGVFTMSN